MSQITPTPVPPTPVPHNSSSNSFWNHFSFDVTQEEDEQARFRFQPQVQDGWRSYNLYSYRTDRHREYTYWLRQVLAINPSPLGIIQTLSAIFFATMPKWFVYSLYLSTGLTPWTIIAGAFFLMVYGTIVMFGIKSRELFFPTAIRLVFGLIGLAIL